MYLKKLALETKTYWKNTGSFTVDPLADIEKQNIEVAVSVDGSWGFIWLDFIEWNSRRAL